MVRSSGLIILDKQNRMINVLIFSRYVKGVALRNPIALWQEQR